MENIKKISLITGGAGFIGANLVYRLLSLGHEVHVVIHSGSNLWRLKKIISDIELHEIDITKFDEVRGVLEKVKPTNIFHLAHYGGNAGQSDIEKVRRVIIEGTATLYKACEGIDSIKSIINTGSSSEYGKKSEPMREDMLVEPNTEYAVAKVWATLYGDHCAREKQLPIITARLFSVYGPFEHRNRFMTEVIIACLGGQMPKLANPKTVRDFVYIDDAIDALIDLSLSHKVGGVYNVGSGKESNLEEVANIIAKYTDFKDELEWGSYGNRSFDTTKWQADISHIEKEIGWKSKTNLDDGIKKTVEWFKENIALYQNL